MRSSEYTRNLPARGDFSGHDKLTTMPRRQISNDTSKAQHTLLKYPLSGNQNLMRTDFARMATPFSKGLHLSSPLYGRLSPTLGGSFLEKKKK